MTTAAEEIAAYACAWGSWTSAGTVERMVRAGAERAQAVAAVAEVKASGVFSGTCADPGPRIAARVEARRLADWARR